MSNVQEALMAENIEAYLKEHEHRSLLRFITCGSVDDGKSTLIGRMLYESHLVFEDHMERMLKIRSLALDFSSSRRAPPKATSNFHLSRACFRPWVFHISVCTEEP